MEKQDIINDIIYSIKNIGLSSQQVDIIKTIIEGKLADCEVKNKTMLPAVDSFNNQKVLERFAIDASVKGTHKSSVLQYIKCVQRLFDFTGKDYRDITGQDVMDWIAIMHYKNNLSQTYRCNLSCWCRAFFNWAYKKHYIQDDVARDIEIIKAKVKPKDRITDEEVELIRNCLKDEREKALFELMICAGLRVGELSNLKISDINFEKKIINVYAEKTDSWRIVNITNRCIVALKIYIKDRDINDYLFKPKYKDGCLNKKSIEKIAKEIGERAGCHLKTTVHVYRKTAGTILNRKTGDLIMTKNMLGHANVAITEKYYLVDDQEEMSFKYQIQMN